MRSFFRFFILPLLGFLLVIVMGYLGFQSGTYVHRQVNQGRFVRWQSIGTPGSRVVQILGADFGSVYVETEDGKVFDGRVHYCLDKKEKDHCWLPISRNEVLPATYRACPLNANFMITHPPESSLARIDLKNCQVETTGRIIFILGVSGEVWVWQHGTSAAYSFMSGVPIVYGGALVGGFIGLVSAIVFFKKIWPDE